MKIHIERTNDHVLFKARNTDGATTTIDGSKEIGGVNGGLRPMEMVLSALATCSAFEIVRILKKQRQVLEDFSIEVKAERQQRETTQPFSRILVAFFLKGAINEKKASRAADLAMNKYCSVKESLHPDIEIDYSIHLNT